MTTFIESLKGLIAYIAGWIYDFWVLCSILAPCVVMLLASKEDVDVILQSKNLPDILNPWVGVIGMFALSFLVINVLLQRAYGLLLKCFWRVFGHNDDPW